MFHLGSLQGLVTVGHVDTTVQPYQVVWDEKGREVWLAQHLLDRASVAYIFSVSGHYCHRLQGRVDVEKEGWEPFDTRDLHPGGEEAIRVWTSCAVPGPEAVQEARERAITLVEWMRAEKGWQGFVARLWLGEPGEQGEEVMRWTLADPSR